MRILATIALLLLTQTSLAQTETTETEGTSQLKILGKSWNPTFYSLAGMEFDKATEAGGRVSTYNYFSFHTFLSGGLRFSLRLPFTYGTAGTDRYNGAKNNNQELMIQDKSE